MNTINIGALSQIRRVALSLLLIVVVGLQGLGTVAADPLITDFGVYPEPPLPAMGPKGSKIVDPTFGTTIMRITDATDGAQNEVMYSYIPTVNLDSSKLVVITTPSGTFKRATYYDFNPTAFTFSGKRIQANPPSGMQEYWMLWSGTTPNRIYGVGNHSIWQIDIPSTGTTFTNTLVKDLTSQGAGGYITQFSRSMNDDVFAATIVNGSGTIVGYLAYKRSTDTVLKRTLISGVDEVQVDKDGRYLVVVFVDGHDEVWDLQPSPPVLVASLAPNSLGFFHRDLGHGTLVSAIVGNNLGFRSLATPTVITKLLTDGQWPYGIRSDHHSFLIDGDGWMENSRYNTNGEPVAAAFDNELVLIAMDGSKRVRRVAHHRSVVFNYDAQPKANISRDGRFIAFTSNWGNGSGRIDAYIVNVPPIGGVTDTTPPASPSNLSVN